MLVLDRLEMTAAMTGAVRRLKLSQKVKRSKYFPHFTTNSVLTYASVSE